MLIMTCYSSHRKKRWLLDIFYYILLLWTKEMDALANFSSYLTRIIQSHSTHACEGERLRLHCPRHSTISVLSAFYGHSEAPLCSPGTKAGRVSNESCSAFTALQKLLAECQGHRDCQVPVNSHVFGHDPCPGKSKHLQVSYKCKPTEHKKKVGCEGEHVKLHCKYPRVLNIYSAIYGRALEEENVCASDDKGPPPFECLFHGAVHLVSKTCYAKQRCVITVNDHNFRDPCLPGTRKYLSILYACVPQTLLREADPNVFKPTSIPKQNIEKGVAPYPKGSRLPDSYPSSIIVSNSLMTYAYVKEHPEMAALLFVSSVCLGLICALIAVSVRLSCDDVPWRGSQKTVPGKEKAKRNEDDAEDEESDQSTCSLSSDERKGGYCWEVATDTTEAAELAERIERREQVIQEIWMNAYLNGSSTGPH